MKIITGLNEIKELDKPNVHIRDKNELLRKINQIIRDGHEKLQIVTDFDHTLTRHNMDNGKTVLTSFGMFRECPSVPQEYKDEELRLAEKYKPIEVDPVMSVEEKTKHMVAWYLAAHELLKGVKFPRNELTEVGQKMIECFRVITNRLSRRLDDFQPAEQAGFRSGYCTIDHIHALRQIVQKSYEYNQPLCLAFVDYEKAFDSIETWAVLDKESSTAQVSMELERSQVDWRYIEVLKCVYSSAYMTGVQELIEWSERQRVPVLVFSAGLGESVVAALTAASLLLPHVKVISNFLALDENDSVIGIKGDVIHTYNKNEAAIKNTDYYAMVKTRNNVLLMGDNIGDAGMAEGMEHCDVIVKIGFLGRNTEANLQNYMNKFDIVLVNEHTMDLANAILKLVL